ncbi:unnamed protein product, partial [Rotaria sp. Silwood1]
CTLYSDIFLSVVIATNEDQIDEDVNRNKLKANFHRLQAQLLTQMEKVRPHMKTYTCYNQLPHDTFPGVQHYFNNIFHKLPSLQKQSFNKDKRIISSKNIHEESDDDNVIYV